MGKGQDRTARRMAILIALVIAGYLMAGWSRYAASQQERSLMGFLSAVAAQPQGIMLDAAYLSDEGTIDIIVRAPTFEPPQDLPGILIYHTHTTEAYTWVEGQDYEDQGDWRTPNNDYNIVKVGEMLAEALRERGFYVVHDTTDHEPPRLGTAYSRSLKTVEEHLATDPNIGLIIDLHRDAYNAGIDPLTVTVEGKACARIMAVVGTGEGREDLQFSVKPDWEPNLALAEAVTAELEAVCPKLTRPVRVKVDRYNQHLGDRAMLLEMGCNTNTLEEVLNAVPHLAEAILRAFS